MSVDYQAKRGLLSSGSEHNRNARGSYDLSDSDRDSDIDATEFLTTDPLHGNDVSDGKGDKKTHGSSASFSWLVPARFRKRWSRSRCCILALVVGGTILLLTAASGGFVYKKLGEEPLYGQSPPWYPAPLGGTAQTWADSYTKAAKLVSRMTLPEKVNITTGTGWQMGLSVGTNGPAVHVGFPQLNLQDGPLGIRMADNITALPAGITVGATWNRALMYAHGKAHAEEARAKGVHALLGPCVGPLGRMPAGGRNWEGFGSDPYLQGIAAAETIRGIQDQGIMATIKHFVGNEQEHFRQPYEWGLPHALSSNIDDRTLHELYAWPFGDAVKAGVASVMCSYNMVNNSYSCGNSKLLNGILKDELGFQGFVMSDWLAQRSGVSTALAGLDMTMPGDGLRWQNGRSLWGPELTRSVLNGSVPLERLNDMATRIVAAWYQMGQDDPNFFHGFDGAGERPNFSSWTHNRTGVLAPGSPSTQDTVVVNQFVDVQGDHANIARHVATEGIVLLKNTNNTLPIGTDGITGQPNRIVKTQHPAPQSERDSTASPTPRIKIGIFGEDAGPGQGPNYCENRACNQGTLGSGWGSGAVEFPYLTSPVDALSSVFDERKVDLRRRLSNHGVHTETLKDLDVCIVFANADAGEGFVSWGGIGGDRNDLLLQKGGDDLVYSVAIGCGDGKGDVIVVIHSVGPVVMERWIDLPQVKALVYANLPGQESGDALADVLFGRVNPSGKLPYTIGRTLEDFGPGGKVMYLPNGVVPQQDFSEGLYIDYRHFDKYDITPRFEFGYGLSYTDFVVGNLSVQGVLPKSSLPSARPPPAATPPTYSNEVPDIKEALFPKEIRRLEKYIYPYLDTVDDLDLVSTKYPYPDGYDTVQPPSGAGGDEGGNPDLWQAYVSVSVDVQNTGSRDGKAVVQLYLSYPEDAADAAGVDFPVKVLRGFEKPMLKKGETQTVTFNLTRRDLSYWDVQQQNWVMVTGGQYRFHVGQSSRDLPVLGTW
ncbi:beta-glucosidase [Sporothrix brasiliensis 5110]|uniref:beta-glucosidase n=1 Tax=Sporothrix brasiliensis 5110 TaxID=1398154 RepID=A0A0C2F4H7_9PEZI|nr:beta-glucosidase [Sporothrix brasiliensis 5110]KIH93804.1 beta-glucosidase [Sporothrix brasiliensis 5110]